MEQGLLLWGVGYKLSNNSDTCTIMKQSVCQMPYLVREFDQIQEYFWFRK
jgi:hypothetical protein